MITTTMVNTSCAATLIDEYQQTGFELVTVMAFDLGLDRVLLEVFEVYVSICCEWIHDYGGKSGQHANF